MSIWVVFEKDGGNGEVEEEYASEQAIAFFIAPASVMQHYNVNMPFVQEYRRHVNTRPRPKTVKEWLVRLLPWCFPVESFMDRSSGYWEEGSAPFQPELLLEWATRWRQLLEYASPEELERLLVWVPDDSNLSYFKEALESYQEFARKAADQGWLIRMSMG